MYSKYSFLIARIVTAMIVLAGLTLAGCQTTRNFTTYYNLFYNIERLDDEINDEVGYQREQRAAQPAYYIPYDDLERGGDNFYPYLERRVFSPDEMRTNRIKIDSIIIKGSKLLARSAKSDYVDGAVYYIAKAYFYKSEWYLSQKKCEELIAAFPESQYAPEAHLLLAMNMLKQGNTVGGETMLSRAIDIAWAQQRKDVLTEAFRLNADVALVNGDMEKALKPYRRAITLSTTSEDKARWQYEIAIAYFRKGRFAETLKELDKVGTEYSPDLLTTFQTNLQRAVTLRILGKYDEAEKELAALRSNGNYESWYGLVDIEGVNLTADRNGTEPDEKAMQRIDSVYPGRNYPAYSIYEHGLRAFKAGNYSAALSNFRTVQSARIPYQRRAQWYTGLLTTYFTQLGIAAEQTRIPLDPYPDSTKNTIADAYYNVARVFVKIGKNDSLMKYYELSSKWAPFGSLTAARTYYARSVMLRSANRNTAADSLLEILVKDYSLTEYAAEARQKLGYTKYAKADSAEDLYNSGLSFMNVGEYERANEQFRKTIRLFPLREYAPQAYYALGMIFEQRLDNLDSAYEYYSQLVDAYPESEQAQVARLFVNARRAALKLPPHSGGMRKDSTGKGGVPGQATDDNDDSFVPLGSPRDGKPFSVAEPIPPMQGNVPVLRSTYTVPPSNKGGEVNPGSVSAPPVDVAPADPPKEKVPAPATTSPTPKK